MMVSFNVARYKRLHYSRSHSHTFTATAATLNDILKLLLLTISFKLLILIGLSALASPPSAIGYLPSPIPQGSNEPTHLTPTAHGWALELWGHYAV